MYWTAPYVHCHNYAPVCMTNYALKANSTSILRSWWLPKSYWGSYWSIFGQLDIVVRYGQIKTCWLLAPTAKTVGGQKLISLVWNPESLIVIPFLELERTLGLKDLGSLGPTLSFHRWRHWGSWLIFLIQCLGQIPQVLWLLYVHSTA